MRNTLLHLFAVCLLPTLAAEPLAPGSPAPPLGSGEFVQGEPVKEFEKGKVYIIEFWATWCGPCVAVIPHVNELQKKFADQGLVVIGQNVWERDEAKVMPFIEKMGDKMTYRVAMDDKSGGGRGRMAESWMEAAGQKGIPAAFVVDKEGMIAWIGHPAGLNEELLGQIFDGSFDSAAHGAAMKQQKEAENKIRDLFGKFRAALNENHLEEAATVVDELVALDDPRLELNIVMFRFDIAVKSGDGKAAGEHALVVLDLARKMTNKNQAAFVLNGFATQLCNAGEMEDLDPKLVVQLGEEATTLSGGTNGVVLSTLAHAKFNAGDTQGAIASQEAAIGHAANDEHKAKLEKTLAAYKEGKLPEAE